MFIHYGRPLLWPPFVAPPRSGARAPQPVADFQAYADSKLMMILWSQELHRRLQGAGIDVFSVHPGEVLCGNGVDHGLNCSSAANLSLHLCPYSASIDPPSIGVQELCTRPASGRPQACVPPLG